MSKIVEIRWHGRGGQGAKTACLLLADAAFSSGKYVQGFPEYGPERMGAPITAYNRISDERCDVHSFIYRPDYVVVVDESLLDSVDVTAGLSPEGAVIINSPEDPAALRPLLRGYRGKVCTIDARRISEAAPGPLLPQHAPCWRRPSKFPASLSRKGFMNVMEIAYRHKFATKPQVIEKNLACLKQSMKEVREG